jgi:hypothetical protein
VEEAASLVHPGSDQFSADDIEQFVQFFREPDPFTKSELYDDAAPNHQLVTSNYQVERLFQFVRYPDWVATSEANKIKAHWRPPSTK